MTTHELARKLLEGPDQPVVLQGHEPNEDTFDVVERVDSGPAWEYWDALHDGPPPEWRQIAGAVEPTSVTVIR